MDASKEHYITGSLELEEAIEVPATLRRFKPVSGTKALSLHLARWRDLDGFKDVKVKAGSVVVRHRLRSGEQLFFSAGHRAKAEPSLPPIELEFEVSSLGEVFVKASDRVEIGQLLALGPEGKELRLKKLERDRLAEEVENLKKRLELGLSEMGEYRAAVDRLRRAEAEIALMEEARRIRSPIAGTIESLKVEGAGFRLRIRVSITTVSKFTS